MRSCTLLSTRSPSSGDVRSTAAIAVATFAVVLSLRTLTAQAESSLSVLRCAVLSSRAALDVKKIRLIAL